MATEILNTGTQVLSGGTTDGNAIFTGGLLRKGEVISGWTVEDKINTISGEADLYIVVKNGGKGIVKYYRSKIKPKTEILEKLKGLNHPDIVNVFDFGFYNDRFYEIMEYAEGGSLDARNTDGSYTYLPLSEEQTSAVCKEIINSYKTCHEKGIIHRDIKPANLYYRKAAKLPGGKRKGEDIVIGDFGISSIMEEAAVQHKTQTASRTSGYAAPEVLSGIISPKMDYYALGITLWELQTGKDPFVLENGKRRNDAHLIRDTIEGRIADDLLSKKPQLSKSMQHLIRGLLVIDPEHRWGYDEVTRHLNGETVPVYEKTKKSWKFTIGDQECTSLEALGSALVDNPAIAQKYVFRGLLGAFLEADFPSESKKIAEIVEESSANNDYYNGILKAAYLLSPGMQLKVGNGFSVSNLDDILFLLGNAPETMLPLLRDEKSKIYTYLQILGYAREKEEIQNLPDNSSDADLLSKAEVILRRKTIKPFKLEHYTDFELSDLEQIRNIPTDLQNHILMLVKEKSHEGLFVPWLGLMNPEIATEDINTTDWPQFLESIDGPADRTCRR
jgi:hypothetical protein